MRCNLYCLRPGGASVEGSRARVECVIEFLLRFIYSEKAAKFCEISKVDLTGTI